MKKIVNWTFGGFFRTIGRTIAFLVIGALIALIAYNNDIKITRLLGIETVSAAELTPTSFNFDARFAGHSCSTITNRCTLNSYGTWAGTVSGGTAILANNADITMLSIKYYYSNNFVANNTYNFKIRINTSYNRYTTLKEKWKIFDIRAGASTSDLSNDAILSYAILNITHDSENDKVYYVTISVTPVKNVKYIWIYYGYPSMPQSTHYTDDFSTSPFYFGNVVVRNSGVAYTESTSSAINQQTQAINNQTQIIIDTNQQLQDTLTDDDVSSSTDEADSFFSSFTTNTHGLTGIITAPLNAINSLTSATCSPLVLPIPYMNNKNLTLPCMRQIYVDNFGPFMTLYDVITTGIIAYWVCVRIFGLVKDFKNPDHDEIEVVDL